MNLKGKTVCITGSSKGLGKSLALAFASRSYNVILHGRDENRLKDMKEAILYRGVRCRVVIGDITTTDTIDRLSKCAEEENIDILINNAGIYLNKTVEEMSVSEFKEVLDVNLIAPVLLSKNIAAFFKKKKSGLIININSLAGKTSSPQEAAYCASKHGLKGFMGAFQFETLQYNVPILNIYSGAIHTHMTEGRGATENFINADELAEYICMTSQDYKNMRVSEIEILRKLY